MLKTHAIELLGGTISTAAKEIGISYQAVEKWPDVLPARIEDRVIAAIARKRYAKQLGLTRKDAPAVSKAVA